MIGTLERVVNFLGMENQAKDSDQPLREALISAVSNFQRVHNRNCTVAFNPPHIKIKIQSRLTYTVDIQNMRYIIFKGDADTFQAIKTIESGEIVSRNNIEKLLEKMEGLIPKDYPLPDLNSSYIDKQSITDIDPRYLLPNKSFLEAGIGEMLSSLQKRFPDDCEVDVVEHRFRKSNQKYFKHFYIVKDNNDIYDLFVSQDLSYILYQGPFMSKVEKFSGTITSSDDIHELEQQILSILEHDLVT